MRDHHSGSADRTGGGCSPPTALFLVALAAGTLLLVVTTPTRAAAGGAPVHLVMLTCAPLIYFCTCQASDIAVLRRGWGVPWYTFVGQSALLMLCILTLHVPCCLTQLLAAASPFILLP